MTSYLRELIEKEKKLSDELILLRHQIDDLLEEEIMNLYQRIQDKISENKGKQE